MHATLIDTDSMWAWGSRMLSSVLKRSGHDARIVLMDSSEEKYTSEELRCLESLVRGSRLVGISCHSLGSDKAQQILRHLKSQGVLTVWGGIHATLNVEECAEFADMVCVGEGEGAILDLVTQLGKGLDWRSVLNIAYKNKGSIVRNPLRPLVEMDGLPVLDFSCDDEYQLIARQLVRRSHTRDLVTEEIPFLGSRGCAYHCTYCCNSKLRQTYSGAGRYVRKHSVSGFIERAAALKKDYFPNGKRIFFVDDDFLDRSIDELKEFSDKYPEVVGLPFECQVSPMRVNEERVALLEKAGVWRIRMGVESGSERTKRDLYRRPMPNAEVIRASEVLAQYPAIVRAYYFIIGNPMEDKMDLLDTIRLILRLPPPYFVQVFNLVFFPGSVLYDRATTSGLIVGKRESGYDLHYRGGLKYRRHSWKLKNLYLNMLLFMMEGKVTESRIGLVPRVLVRVLIQPWFITLNERQLTFAKAMIAFKTAMLALRAGMATILKRIVRNKELLYNPGTIVWNRIHRLFGVARS